MRPDRPPPSRRPGSRTRLAPTPREPGRRRRRRWRARARRQCTAPGGATMRQMSEPIVVVRTGVRDDYEAVAALQREIQEAHWRAAPAYFQPPSPETLTRATFDGWLADADRE